MAAQISRSTLTGFFMLQVALFSLVVLHAQSSVLLYHLPIGSLEPEAVLVHRFKTTDLIYDRSDVVIGFIIPELLSLHLLVNVLFM